MQSGAFKLADIWFPIFFGKNTMTRDRQKYQGISISFTDVLFGKELNQALLS